MGLLGRFAWSRWVLLAGVMLVTTASSAWALTYSEVKADAITYSSVRIAWNTDSNSPTVIRYGTAVNRLDRVQTVLTPGVTTRHRYFLSGLVPNTEYFYQVCESPEKCNADRFSFRTLVRPAISPTPAELPRQIADPNLFTVPPLPAIDGNTYRVAPDCSDLPRILRDAAAADGNLNHQILIPVGVDCTPPSTKIIGIGNAAALTLPAKNGPNPNGTGEIILRSAAPDEVLPPEGVRTGPSFFSQMPILRNSVFGVRELFSPASVGNGCTPGQLWWHFNQPGWSLKQCSDPASNGYTLVPRIDFRGTPPATCQASNWYFKADVEASLNGIYWCTAQGKLFQMTTGRQAAFNFADNAHHYRFFGLQFSIVPMGDQPWKSQAVYSDGSYYAGLFELSASVHHITFDRCYFGGLDTPERLFMGFYSAGSYVSWQNNYVDKVSFWLPSGDVGDIEAFPLQLVGGRFLKILNNYIEGTGITLLASEDFNAVTTDVEFLGNTLTRPERYRAGTAANRAEANSRFYQSRHLFELKRGVRWLVDGNVFDGNFATVNQGHIIALSPRPGTTIDPPPEVAFSDIVISNNLIQDSPNGIYVIGHNDFESGQMPTLARVEIKNNLILGIDGSRVARNTPGRWGHCLTVLQGVEDLTVRHNVCYDNNGQWPAFLWEQHGPSAGLDFRDNIMTVRVGDVYGGLISPGAARGRASLDKGFPNSYVFSNNALINIAKDNPRDYPSNNYWADSVWDIGWTDHTQRNFRLKEDSLFRAGASVIEGRFGPASDDQEVGVVFADFDKAQRLVSGVSLQAGSQQARLNYRLAANEGSCPVDLSTDLFFRDPVRFRQQEIAEDDPAVRTIPLTDLKPETRYYWRLLCRTVIRGEFTTAKADPAAGLP